MTLFTMAVTDTDDYRFSMPAERYLGELERVHFVYTNSVTMQCITALQCMINNKKKYFFKVDKYGIMGLLYIIKCHRLEELALEGCISHIYLPI